MISRCGGQRRRIWRQYQQYEQNYDVTVLIVFPSQGDDGVPVLIVFPSQGDNEDTTLVRPDFFISWFTGFFFQTKGRGDEKKNK